MLTHHWGFGLSLYSSSRPDWCVSESAEPIISVFEALKLSLFFFVFKKIFLVQPDSMSLISHICINKRKKKEKSLNACYLLSSEFHLWYGWIFYPWFPSYLSQTWDWQQVKSNPGSAYMTGHHCFLRRVVFKGCADSAALWLLTICEQLLQGSCPVFNGLQRLLCVVAKVMGPYSRVSGILNKITTESHTLLHLDFLCFCASNTTVFVYRTYIVCQWCWFYTDTDKLDLWIWWCHFREWVWWVILARRSSIFLCSGCLSEG